MDSTLTYYDQFGREFAEATAGVDIAELQRRFLGYLPPGGRIRDAGCGSGRDSLAFARLGYEVT